MRAIIVVSVDLPEPDDLAKTITAMDPPGIPHFAGQVRIAIGEPMDHVLEYLDEASGERDEHG